MQKTLIFLTDISSPLAITQGNSLPTQVHTGVEGKSGGGIQSLFSVLFREQFKIDCLGEAKEHEHGCVVY